MFCFEFVNQINCLDLSSNLQERVRVYADTLSSSFDNLHRLLQLIDYSGGYFFLSVRSELRQVIKDALKNANIGICQEYINLLYHLPKEDALKFSVE